MPRSAGTRPLDVGWVLGGQTGTAALWRQRAIASGGTGLVRFRWLVDTANRTLATRVRHRLYLPWRRHDVLVFLKSMGPAAEQALWRQARRGGKSVFDANVNYYEHQGVEHYQGMLPTDAQHDAAVTMTRSADGVIADSLFLRQVAMRYTGAVEWIPDSVPMERVPQYRPSRPGKRCVLAWCGESLKLFELLAIEDVLRRHAGRIELLLVTNDRAAIARWNDDRKERFEALLRDVPHRFEPYRSVEHLWACYQDADAVISPRHLDNSYNLGHTEWKITLGMACGRVALCSPVPSYVEVERRAAGTGVTVCRNGADWDAALDALMGGAAARAAAEQGARAVVERDYSTAVVTERHTVFLEQVAAGGSHRV